MARARTVGLVVAVGICVAVGAGSGVIARHLLRQAIERDYREQIAGLEADIHEAREREADARAAVARAGADLAEIKRHVAELESRAVESRASLERIGELVVEGGDVLDYLISYFQSNPD